MKRVPGPHEGLRSLPGFVSSLRLLIDREQYSQQDIAMMFGVSRERIRQLCELEGIRTVKWRGMSDLRVWSDAQNRFLPVPRAYYTGVEQVIRRRTKPGLVNWYRAEVRDHMVAALTALASRANGRPVTSAEAWEAISGRRLPPQTAVSSVTLAYNWFAGVKRPARNVVSVAKRELSALTGIMWRTAGMPKDPAVDPPANPPAERPVDPQDPYQWTPWVPPFHKVTRTDDRRVPDRHPSRPV